MPPSWRDVYQGAVSLKVYELFSLYKVYQFFLLNGLVKRSPGCVIIIMGGRGCACSGSCSSAVLHVAAVVLQAGVVPLCPQPSSSHSRDP